MAEATLQDEFNLSKNSSLTELNFSVGFNLSGNALYITFALSINIALVLSSLSANVKPEKFLLTIANASISAVISVVKPCCLPLRTKNGFLHPIVDNLDIKSFCTSLKKNGTFSFFLLTIEKVNSINKIGFSTISPLKLSLSSMMSAITSTKSLSFVISCSFSQSSLRFFNSSSNVNDFFKRSSFRPCITIIA